MDGQKLRYKGTQYNKGLTFCILETPKCCISSGSALLAKIKQPLVQGWAVETTPGFNQRF